MFVCVRCVVYLFVYAFGWLVVRARFIIRVLAVVVNVRLCECVCVLLFV